MPDVGFVVFPILLLLFPQLCILANRNVTFVYSSSSRTLLTFPASLYNSLRPSDFLASNLTSIYQLLSLQPLRHGPFALRALANRFYSTSCAADFITPFRLCLYPSTSGHLQNAYVMLFRLYASSTPLRLRFADMPCLSRCRTIQGQAISLGRFERGWSKLQPFSSHEPDHIHSSNT